MASSSTHRSRAAYLSGLLRNAGYNPIPSGSPRDGRLYVRSGMGAVSVRVDLEAPRRDALAMVEEIRELLAARGYRLSDTVISEHDSEHGGTYEWAAFRAWRPDWYDAPAPAPMTVEELIKLLQAVPAGLEVRATAGTDQAAPCGSVEQVTDDGGRHVVIGPRR